LSLRNNRPARPVGSRPLPSKAAATLLHSSDVFPSQPQSAPGPQPYDLQPVTALPQVNEPARRESVQSCNQQAPSPVVADSSVRSRTLVGRPLAAGPDRKSYSIRGRKVSPTAVIEPPAESSSGHYRESGSRWLERQEAISLREALREMDLSEEKKIHAAAQDEAADLVWRHRNPNAAELENNAAYFNPDLTRQNRHKFTAHLRKGAYSRSQSLTDFATKGCLPTSGSFGSSAISTRYSSEDTVDHDQKIRGENCLDETNVKAVTVCAPEPLFKSNGRKSSGQRKTSNGSSKDSFPNPSEQIYEDSGSLPAQQENASLPISATPGPLRSTNRNSQLRGSRPFPGRPSQTDLKNGSVERFEIHKNPPSQSRSAGYTRNSLTPSIDVIPEAETPPSKNGIEIRGDDIRAATSMKLKDRSPKLPIPTAVSDRPGRPIVSFDLHWRPDDAAKHDNLDVGPPGPRPSAATPALSVSAPAIPTINVSESPGPCPTIILPEDEPIPSITVCMDQPSSTMVKAPASTSRPLPQPSKTMPAKLATEKTASRLPWLKPSARTGAPTATCANCALPISGRIVTASGAGCPSSLNARFHPECFTCHHCSTALECVAFYPEPEDKRAQRLAAEDVSDHNAQSELRFYCHLDFHEFFSPRCRSCKTPIEGEVIVAAGAEWHVGHFFCAECGDPFDSNTPFVEKDNYAYCVACHSRRTSARCRACKKQILDEMTIEALGGQWHADCFNCYECAGGFGDDGRFFIRDVTVEGTDKEKRRGVATRVEERAVCEACEGRRLKA
jgi:LIM domain